LAVKEDGAPPPLQLIKDAFRDAWQRELDADLPLQAAEDDEPADTGALVDKGTEMLAVFHDHAVKNLDGAKVEAVEQPFSVSLFDPDTGVEMEENLVGVLDLVLKKGRRRQVVEHKTSARKYGDDQLRYDIQPTGYRLAARAMGLGDVKVTYPDRHQGADTGDPGRGPRPQRGGRGGVPARGRQRDARGGRRRLPAGAGLAVPELPVQPRLPAAAPQAGTRWLMSQVGVAGPRLDPLPFSPHRGIGSR
jgi:hypothetical protein